MGSSELTSESYIIDIEIVVIRSAGFRPVGYVADGPSDYFTGIHKQARLHMKNIIWIDPSQSNLRGITATDKCSHWGWKLDYPIWPCLFAEFGLKCAVLIRGLNQRKEHRLTLLLKADICGPHYRGKDIADLSPLPVRFGLLRSMWDSNQIYLCLPT